ncbi:MAG: hypothetical protein IPQ23_02630 [Cytophagaceae bacterium]|nr:hypothetical protein [Cytophagaceae bacterium]
MKEITLKCAFCLFLIASFTTFAQKKKLVAERTGRTATREVVTPNYEALKFPPTYEFKSLGAFINTKDSEVAACQLDKKDNDKILGLSYLNLANGIDTVKKTIKIEETYLSKIEFPKPIKVISSEIKLTKKNIIVQYEKKGIAIHSRENGELVRYIPLPYYTETNNYFINKSGEIIFIMETEITGKFINLETGVILSEIIAPEGASFTGAFNFMKDDRKYLIGFKPSKSESDNKKADKETDSLDIFNPQETERMKEIFTNQEKYSQNQFNTGLVFGDVYDDSQLKIPQIINDSVSKFIDTKHVLFAKNDSLIITVQSKGTIMLYELKAGNYKFVKLITTLIHKKRKIVKETDEGFQIKFSLSPSKLLKANQTTKNVVNAAVSPNGQILLLNNRVFPIEEGDNYYEYNAKTGITVMAIPDGKILGFFDSDIEVLGIDVNTNSLSKNLSFTEDGKTFFTNGKSYSVELLSKFLDFQHSVSLLNTTTVTGEVLDLKLKNKQ